MRTIYLDNAATTQCYPEVVDVMRDSFLLNYGNASSTHSFGDRAKELMNHAREAFAKEINSKSHEIIFTSGATESNNMAILGISVKSKSRNKIIISKIEHSATYEPCMRLKSLGFEIVEIKVNNLGLIDMKELEKEIDSKTLLVSVIHANNELGVVQDIESIGRLCNKRGVFFHVDCAQSFGKIPIDINKMGISLLSASAHKIHGPKGVGFLFVRKGIELEPIMYGAGQERGLRSGTENIPGIIGFAKALEMIKKVDREKVRKLRDYFMKELELLGGKINGSVENRIYNNLHVSLPIDAELVISYLSNKGIMLSTRSACSSNSRYENRVLKAIGLKDKEISGSLRIVLNQFITKKDVDYTLKEIKNAMKSFK